MSFQSIPTTFQSVLRPSSHFYDLFQQPLCLAVYHGHFEVVKILIQEGADKEAVAANILLENGAHTETAYLDE